MFSAVSALLAACAFPQPTRPVYQPPLPEFESIAVFSKGPSDDLKARFSRESTKSGAAIGFQGGAVAGLGASLVCGPWFWLCALGTVPAGAVVGAAGGAAAGSVKDSNRKPTDEELDQLEANFEVISRERTLHSEIENEVVGQIPEQFLATPADAEALVELELTNVRFAHITDGAFALEVGIVVTTQWNRQTKSPRVSKRVYNCRSKAEYIEYWADEDGSRLNTALDDCVKSLADDYGSNLRFPATN
jgi:hypothetical protein